MSDVGSERHTPVERAFVTLHEAVPGLREYKPLDEFPRNKNSQRRSALRTASRATTRVRQGDRYAALYGGSRHYHLKQRYGIGADEFDELVRQQGGVCAICGRAEIPSTSTTTTRPATVRGILCFNCNGGLGQFRDSIDALLAAAAYLDARPHRDGRQLDWHGIVRSGSGARAGVRVGPFG